MNTPPRATGRPCTICKHPDRATIDGALAAGDGPRVIADRFGLSHQSVIRHRAGHVPTSAMQAGAAAAAEAAGLHGAGLLQDAAGLRDKARELLAKAEAAGDLRTALQGVREAARCLELMAKLAGELDDTPTVNVLIQPQFLAVQQAIITALAPHPEARSAVLRALEAVQ